MSVPDYTNMITSFFNAHKSEYDFKTWEGCGKFTEAFVTFAKSIDNRIKHLKKSASQTQYNGHAIDAILFDDGQPLLCAVDLIGNAESDDARPTWNVDIPRYTANDIWTGNQPPVPVFPSYESLGGDKSARDLLGKLLALDYSGVNKPMDDGTVVWTFRTLYDALYDILVNKAEPQKAINKSIDKHRKEWRKELGYQDA